MLRNYEVYVLNSTVTALRNDFTSMYTAWADTAKERLCSSSDLDTLVNMFQAFASADAALTALKKSAYNQGFSYTQVPFESAAGVGYIVLNNVRAL